MTPVARPSAFSFEGEVVSQSTIAANLHVLELELPGPVAWLPGQFAMLNFTGRDRLVFSRPFSILAGQECRVSLLYRVVGRGTTQLARTPRGAALSFFGPLGSPFPAPAAAACTILIAGGCGLPPLYAWHERYGLGDGFAFFGARTGAEVPWGLLGASWRISVDRHAHVPGDREAATGLVVDHCRSQLAASKFSDGTILACGPRPMLRAAAALARDRGWRCFVSLEEHMGCGYGVCRGCVVPTVGGGHLTACQDGPVVEASALDWSRFMSVDSPSGAAPVICPGDSPGQAEP
jgi:dihydroorotate dehydrogenase electron transfer subunit